MKVLMTADARSIHTRRWAVSLKERGVDIVLYSLYPSPDDFFEVHGIKLYEFDLFTYKSRRGIKAVSAAVAMHFKAVSCLKKILKSEAPDILHAHYATSFGFVAALTGFHPFIISVWGSDVYEFPDQSFFNMKAVQFVFRQADKILSTSHIMARRTSAFTSRPISVTPFGVDTELFRRLETHGDGRFVVGNVKTLAPKYGIDILIRAFKIVMERNPELDTVLVIVGDGPFRGEYESLARNLGIEDKVKFIGKVPNHMLPSYYNSFSVSVSVSNSESFGVVAVEAMACGCPVVVSDADGFTEVVEDGITGYIVPKRDPEAAAAAIQKFIDNPGLRESMGTAGIERVRKLYDWNDNVDIMYSIYTELCNGGKSKGKNC